MTEAPGHRLLVSVLGTRSDESLYELSGRTYGACLAPVALLALESFDEVIALCTQEAEQKTLPKLRSGAGSVTVTSVAVPEGVGQDDIGAFLEVFTKSIPEGSQVVVDITHGFRHLSFLTLLGALYASTLGRAEVQSAYYARQRPPPDSSPFVDLNPLLELAGFLYAVRVLRERGDPQPLADELRRLTGKPTEDVARELAAISHAYASALPLELGRHAALFLRDRLNPFRRELSQRRLPLIDELVEEVRDGLATIALPVVSGQGWKRETALDENELRRQARVIDELLERRSLGPALTLMEEWVISWACLRLGLASRWLDRDARGEAASKLHALVRIETGPLETSLAEGQHELARFWRALSEARNAYAHAGMRGAEVDGELGEEVRDGWKTMTGAPDWSLEVPARSDAPVLVSAVGTTPGPLYSALCSCPTDPVCVVAICSQETESYAKDALRHAKSKAKLSSLVFADPVGGTSEIERVVDDATRDLLEGPNVFVNLTGGTTLMGLAVERIAQEARRLGQPVRRFGLIDRRPREEQLANPFVAAEPYWLDDQEDVS